VVAGGESAAMALAVEQHWPSDAPLSGLVITRYQHGLLTNRIQGIEVGQPVPDESGESEAKEIFRSAKAVGGDDLALGAGFDVYMVNGHQLHHYRQAVGTRAKTDTRDARSIGHALVCNQLNGIYVPTKDQETDRHLVRQRKKIWRDLVRCKNRIKGFLDYKGIEVPSQYDNANWSRNFITWLSKLEFEHSSNRVTLDHQLKEMELLRKELLSVSNAIRKLMRSKRYNKLYYLLRTVTGIGPLTAASLITEIGDIKRFSNFYHLNSFIVLMPMEQSGGER